MTLRVLQAISITGLMSACVTLGPRSAPDVSAEAADRLTADLPNLVLSLSLVAVGIAAVALAKFHWVQQGVPLLSFGMFSFLYGVRLLVWTPSSRLLVELRPIAWDYVEAIITYFIPIAVLFFLEPLLGKLGKFQWVRWLWRIQLAYAIVATVVDIATGAPFASIGPYRVLVVIWFLGALYLMFWRLENLTKQLKIVRAGLLVFVILAGHATISGAFPLPGMVNAEPLGLFVFFLSLGYVVVDGFFSSQKELGAIHQELETARKIQATVLPETLPATDGVELAVRYLPVSAVAGDFYDYLESERGLSLLVADVSGHGVPAALIASMVKVAYSAQRERAFDPAAVLSEVNRILCGKIRGQFVTGGCLFVADNGSKVTYASAGHPPLVVVRASGEVSEYKLDSVLMGFFAGAEYAREEVALDVGDTLVLYTDGLTEAMNGAGEFFGSDRLLAFLGKNTSETAESLASGIVDHVQSWSGRAFDDDVTLLVVTRC